MADDFGIVWETTGPDSGLAVFATPADREEAIAWPKTLGARYLVSYTDVQGAGLSWAWKTNPEKLRPTRRDRLLRIRRRAGERSRRGRAAV